MFRQAYDLYFNRESIRVVYQEFRDKIINLKKKRSDEEGSLINLKVILLLLLVIDYWDS